MAICGHRTVNKRFFVVDFTSTIQQRQLHRALSRQCAVGCLILALGDFQRLKVMFELLFQSVLFSRPQSMHRLRHQCARIVLGTLIMRIVSQPLSVSPVHISSRCICADFDTTQLLLHDASVLPVLLHVPLIVPNA